MAQGLLGDLLAHEPRALQARTGLALERGALGTWLVGEGGALLVVPGGRRVHCFCVRVTDRDLPPSDRVAHLLLALREDEVGFATVANHAFAGAPLAGPAAAAAAMRGVTRTGRSALASPAVAYEVVIAGGGFGGSTRRAASSGSFRGTAPGSSLVTAENFMLYTPLLPGAASGSLEPRHVVVPLREELEWTDIRLGRVTGR